MFWGSCISANIASAKGTNIEVDWKLDILFKTNNEDCLTIFFGCSHSFVDHPLVGAEVWGPVLAYGLTSGATDTHDAPIQGPKIGHSSSPLVEQSQVFKEILILPKV